MNEAGQKTYGFKLLEDEVIDADFFEDKTHENVAETLYKLIDANDNGFTIGLEGAWGSGKSTVISILKKKMKNKAFHYFYFDAWAHEGDHLRRIFLESLLSQLGTKSQKFIDLKKEISNHKRKTINHTEQHGTNLGKLLAASVLFVPLGAGLVSGVDSSKLSFQWDGTPHWPFLIGIFFSIIPFFVIVGNIFYTIKKDNYKNILNAENWAFLENDNTTSQEISEEEERSSIEFEQYFGDIISEVFKDDTASKLIIVVDNLDRIDANDSLKIWSTLQTFLQHRNPSNSKCQWYKNIWIIVPYDMNGLSKLWENETKSVKDKSIDCSLGSCAKSFFDKCFQIRIEVPEPVLTGWEDFTREMLNKALSGWPNEEKNNVLRILKLTRDHLGDAPTPREIKNYINQVGILRLHTCEEIPTESIAYYAIHKYLKGTSTEKIKTELIINQLPMDKDKPFLPSDCNKHLAGIIFGVEPKKGQQLLLEPEIEKALQDAKVDKLKSLVELHGVGFWSVFEHHINSLRATHTLFNYSKAIYEGLWEIHKEQCIGFTQKIHDFFTSEDSLLPTDGCIEDYLPIIKMDSDITFLERIWNLVLTDLETKIEEDDEFDYETNVKYLENIVESLGNNHKARTFSKVNYGHLVQWAQAADSQQIPAYQWILPPQSIANEIANKISPDSPIIAGTKELFVYSINAGITDWKMLPLACRNHIIQNNGRLINENQPSIEVLEILVWLSSYDKCRDEIKELLETGEFHNFVYHQQKNESEIYSALLMAYYFKNELHNISVPALEKSLAGLQLMQDVWTNRDEMNAKAMFDYLKKFKHLDILWDLVENEDNKLVVDIIDFALKDEVPELFSCSDVLKKMHFIMEIIKDKDGAIEEKLVNQLIDPLVNQLMKYSEIEKEIKNSPDLDVSNYSEELLLILKKTDDKEVIDGISTALTKLGKEEWDGYFAEDTYLADLALESKNKNSKFSLKNAYLDSIFEFAKQWDKDENKVSEWQKTNWTNLVDLIGNDFQISYKDKITKLFLEKEFIVKNEFYEYNRDFFDYQKIFKDGRSKIQDSLEEALKGDGDFDCLEMLDMVLNNNKNGDFVPEDHISGLVSDLLNELYWCQEDTGKKALLNRFAKKFNVEIKEQTLESEEDGDF